jgi:hypothetical protein
MLLVIILLIVYKSYSLRIQNMLFEIFENVTNVYI